jgi:hypothetical protein
LVSATDEAAMDKTLAQGARCAGVAGMLCAFLPAIGAPGSAHAAIIDALQVGVMDHDISEQHGGKESGTADVQFELDTTRPRALRFLGAPRLNLVLALNTANETSFAAAGFTWDHRLYRRLYGKLDIGFALTDGETDSALMDHKRLLLGSKDLFREAVAVEWRSAGPWGVSAQYEHLSNGGLLCSNHHNQGINSAGLSLVYRFR